MHNQCNDWPVLKDDSGRELLAADPDPDDPSDVGPDQAGALLGVIDVVNVGFANTAKVPTS